MYSTNPVGSISTPVLFRLAVSLSVRPSLQISPPVYRCGCMYIRNDFHNVSQDIKLNDTAES